MDQSPPVRPSAPADSPAATRKGMFITDDGQNVFVTFVLLVSLFALWGFCNGLIDVMDKHFQEELHLSYSQSAWVQTAHYLGYLLMALPAGRLAILLGYKRGIIIGLVMVAAGGFWFIPATHIAQFWAFLLGVCAIAAGLTFLETIANPYTTVLGPPQYSATRINLAQAGNGAGLLFGPIVGAVFFYSTDARGVSTGSQTLWIPYCGIAVIVLVLAVVFAFVRMPDIKMEDDYHLDAAPGAPPRSIWKQPHFVAAVATQFLYVASQAGFWGFFVNYLTTQTPALPDSWPKALDLQGGPALIHDLFSGWFVHRPDGALEFSNKAAAILNSFALFCFLMGRLVGTAILKRVAAHRVLAVYGALNAVVCLVIFLKLGWVSVAGIFAAYFLMSIMFPTIFALGIFGLGEQAKKASSFIVMAIVGGAVVPKIMGAVGDAFGLSRGYIVPMLGFAAVGIYGYLWPKLSGHEAMVGVDASKGH